ncbi:uncharacterized protein LOC134832488 [Culicoides brevitarsis]|uniref:uncharacterized protein LOC134832488 n=1 Tax=Culicoides brevitarsis TaxID=469753 RepID=UPI00307B6FD3
MIRENYSRVVTSALQNNVAINSNCGGTFRDNQHLIQSPGYPNHYENNLKCEYTLMAPFVCRNYFHVQFIDFDVEPSRNCSKDYVKVGNEDTLCGQVLGIKKYETEAGVLKIKLVTDGYETRKGFQLLISRLPCINDGDDSSESRTTVFPIYDKESEIGINTVRPASSNIAPSVLPPFTSNRQDIPPPDWNNNGYLPPPPVTSRPIQPVPPIHQNPCFQIPCCPSYNPLFPHYPQNNPFYPIGYHPNHQYPQNHHNFIPNTPPIKKQLPQLSPYPPPGFPLIPQFGVPQQCCRNTFRNRRFYLVSPNFPATNRRPTDCFFVIERANLNICRLRIVFKFFNHGNNFQCFDDFLEVDGRRVCGCKSGLVYTTQWGYEPKIIRYRNSGYQPNGLRGFVLDVIQESCPYRYEIPPFKRIDNTNNPVYITKAQQLGKAMIVHTNSSTISTYYHMADPEDIKVKSQKQEEIGVVDEKTPVVKDVENDLETSGTVAKFYFLNQFNNNNGQLKCNLNPFEWLVLKKSALFIQRPICFRF